MKCVLATLGCLLICLFASCGSSEEALPDLEAVPVRIVEVKVKSRPVYVNTSGTVAGKETALLSFKVSGIIKRLAVQEGDTVRKGTVLAALDQTESRAIVNRAEAAFERAEQDLTNNRKLVADRAIPEEQLGHSEQA